MTSSSSKHYPVCHNLINGPSNGHRHRNSHYQNPNIANNASFVLRPIMNIRTNGSTLVDVNNNLDHQGNRPTTNSHSDVLLNRIAILKNFGSTPSTITTPNVSFLCHKNQQSIGGSKFEKRATARRLKARSCNKTTIVTKKPNREYSHKKLIAYDPAIEEEFLRLRESVPSIAGHHVSDLTIINEAISFICDLETKLLHKLHCQLPDLREQFLK